MRTVVIALAVTVAACAPDAAPAASSLVGGTDDPDATSVFALIDLGRGACTASLVSPHVLVTAKHCVQGPDELSPGPPDRFRVLAGVDIDAPDATYDVVAVATTPGTWTVTSLGGTDGLLGVDVAVVTLADAQTVAPYAIRRERPRGLVGRDLPVWGYGDTPAGGAGRRQRALAHVNNTTSGYAITAPVACGGDSGGPIVDPDAGDILGVASLGADPCGAGPGVYNFVYGLTALIDAAIAAAGDCGAVACPDAGVVDAGATSDAGATLDAGAADAGRRPDAGPRDYTARGGGGCNVAAPFAR